jgi:hypothetical protein
MLEARSREVRAESAFLDRVSACDARAKAVSHTRYFGGIKKWKYIFKKSGVSLVFTRVKPSFGRLCF